MSPISILMFGTIIIVLAIATALLIHHRRKASNRHPMDNVRERNIDEIQRGVPPER